MINPLPDGAVRVAFEPEPVRADVTHEILVSRNDGTRAFWVLRTAGIGAVCSSSYASAFTQFIFMCEADRVRGEAVLTRRGINVTVKRSTLDGGVPSSAPVPEVTTSAMRF